MTKLDQQVIKSYQACFNSSDFYRCHDIIEQQWLLDYPDRNKDNGYIILLQLAVLLHHANNNNYIGAKKLLTSLKLHYTSYSRQQLDEVINLSEFDTELNKLTIALNEEEHLPKFNLTFLL